LHVFDAAWTLMANLVEALFYSRWGWIVGLVLLLLVAVWLMRMFAGA
jgi:hypothetical protein